MAANSQLSATSLLVKQALAKYAASLPSIPLTDNRGRRDTTDQSGRTIGSTTPVDCHYCVETTQVSYTPPTS